MTKEEAIKIIKDTQVIVELLHINAGIEGVGGRIRNNGILEREHDKLQRRRKALEFLYNNGYSMYEEE